METKDDNNLQIRIVLYSSVHIPEALLKTFFKKLRDFCLGYCISRESSPGVGDVNRVVYQLRPVPAQQR